ncbi:hypothetical protein SK128_008873 [Halocaridina rubra]|uniref:Uncharacterized protein n=1 Tax=Halocaridina rubra TaxID=373956 RepID=A0AAN8WX56_HALRR
MVSHKKENNFCLHIRNRNNSVDDDDVPLLSAGVDDDNDAPLLEITSLEDSGDDRVSEEDAQLLGVTCALHTSDSEDSESEGAEVEDRSCTIIENEIAYQDNSALLVVIDDTINQERTMSYNISIPSEFTSLGDEVSSVTVNDHSCSDDGVCSHFNLPDSPNMLGDVLTDTRAAVLALSIVQRHTDDARQSDTELTSQ